MKKEKWVPIVGEKAVIYNETGRSINVITQIIGDYLCFGERIAHRKQCRRFSTNKRVRQYFWIEKHGGNCPEYDRVYINKPADIKSCTSCAEVKIILVKEVFTIKRD